MRKIIFIFALLVACEKINEEPKTKVCMISNSLPVQLWLAGQPTFNEKNEAGIEKRCFFAPLLCNQKISILVPFDGGTVSVFDSAGNFLGFRNLLSLSELENVFDDFTGFNNVVVIGGSTANWTDGSVTISSMAPASISSKDYRKALPRQVNKVRVRFDWSVSVTTSDGPPDNIQLIAVVYKNFTEVSSQAVGDISLGGAGSADFTFSGLPQFDEIGFRLIMTTNSEATGASAVIENLLVDITPAEGVFSLAEFTANDLNACGKKIKFMVYDGDSNLYARSDLFLVRESFVGGRLIKYSNEEEFDGIPYQLGGIDFELLVLSRFFKERQPEENESTDTEGDVDILLATIKDQKKFEVEPAPPYFHKKVKRVLKHNSVFIDNQQWVSEDEYEVEEMNDKSPFDKGTTWLTLKDGSYVTNPFA